ncbi:MAG TPA: CBS domain-containing protein [Thermodesulfobacteriota bacterium]|jgi:predicted transcriptional regulator
MIENLKVRDLIGKREKIYSVDADDITDIAALKLRNFRVRTIGVIKDGRLVGVVGQSDFSTKVVAMNKRPSDLTVSEIMSTNLVTVGIDSSFFECVRLLDTHHISHLVILDEKGSYYGMLSWWDLQQKLIDELRNQLEILQEYAFGPHRNIVFDEILGK